MYFTVMLESGIIVYVIPALYIVTHKINVTRVYFY